MREMPKVVGSSYTTSTVCPLTWNDSTTAATGSTWSVPAHEHWQQLLMQKSPTFPLTVTLPAKQEQNVANPKRRLVQVFIADPDSNVPLNDSLLYTGAQKLTDATDQELFFEIDIKNILEAHNAKRITWPNKTVKERVEYLEPVRIRDLKMVVVTIAEF